MSKEALEAEFVRLYGKPSWNVHKSYSSILYINFGEPKLNVHDPKTVKGKPTRFTEICREWVLWIFGCDWKYFREDTLLGCSELPLEDIHRLAHDINGQALANVIFDNQAKAIFYFDLGGRLGTTPFA